jgi:hypothetical protein
MKHPGPWKVFGGERTEAILDGNGDIVVQARPLEGGRAVLEFGNEEARKVTLATPELLSELKGCVLALQSEGFDQRLPELKTSLALIARLEETA